MYSTKESIPKTIKSTPKSSECSELTNQQTSHKVDKDEKEQKNRMDYLNHKVASMFLGRGYSGFPVV